jgi:hypothetical protein
VKWFGQYGRKASWIVKRYERYGRNQSWIVKRYVNNMEETQVE